MAMRLPNLLDLLHLPHPKRRPGSLSWAGHFRATILLAVPLVISQVAMISIWTADVVMLGRLSTDALAAGTQANRLFQPFYFLALGIIIAVSPLAAQALGSGSRRQARRVMRQGLWLSVIYGAMSFFPMWYGDRLLLLLGQSATIAHDAAPFLKMLALGMIPTYGYFTLRNYIAAHNKPLPAMIVTLGGVACNIALNEILGQGYFGLPELGMAGIGLGTTLTFALMMLALVVYMNIAAPFRSTRPFARLWRSDWGVMKRLLIVGLPISFTLIAETGMFFFTGIYTGIFGTISVAASGIATQIAAIFFMVPLAVGQAATIRVGHEAGAGRRRDAIRAAYAALIISACICLVQTVGLLAFREPMIRAFINPADAALVPVLQLSMQLVFIVALFQISDGLQAVFGNVLRGFNDTRIPALLAFACFWGVGITAAIVLATPLGWGVAGIWWGLFLGLLAGMIMLGYRCFATHRRIVGGGPLLLA